MWISIWSIVQGAPTNSKRGDGWSSIASGLGTAKYDSSLALSFQPDQITNRPQLIRDLMRGNAIARKVVWKQVQLAWSNGITYTVSNGSNTSQNSFQDEIKRLDMRRHIQRGRALGRQFGGALLLVSVDDGTSSDAEPLVLSDVRRILYFRVIDRHSVQQIEYDKTGGIRDGKPIFYTIRGSNGKTSRIHFSRAFRFSGLDTDDDTIDNNSGWEDSVLVPCYSAIRDIDSGGQNLSGQLHKAVSVVYKIKGLHNAILSQDRQFVEDWINSLEYFRGSLRAIGLDADAEDVKYLAAPLDSSVKVFKELKSRVCAATDIPEVELFGTTPAGLSSDDKSARTRFYKKVETEEQQGQQSNCLDFLLPIISAQSDVFDLVGTEITFVWPSLFSPTALESSQLNKIKAETVQILNSTGDLQPGDFRVKAAELLGLDLTSVDTEEEIESIGAILDPTERMQQARLAIASGILHLPDTAQTFRPLLGLEPLESGDTERWLQLVKSSQGSTSEDRGDALTPLTAQRRSLGRFRRQALRLVDGTGVLSLESLAKLSERMVAGLEPLSRPEMMEQILEQFQALNDDLAEFSSKDRTRTELRGLMRRRAELRAEQLNRVLEQKEDREKMVADGAEFFVWKTKGDDKVRPEHVPLDGLKFSLADGHPEYGYPGDAPNCRCVAVAVDSSNQVRADETYIPPQSVQDNARRALDARAELPPSARGMTAVGIARARDLSNGRPVSLYTIKRMLSYFQRHEIDKQSKSWKEQKWSKGKQAWFGWGGDEGYKWSQQIIDSNT